MTRDNTKTHETSFSSRAMLVARPGPDASPHDVDASLDELAQLLTGLGVVVADTAIQRSGTSPPTGAHVLGRGKLEEVRRRIDELVAEDPRSPMMLVFDGALTPGQERGLEAALGIPAIDRTAVILRVFQTRAQTDVARVEVELARLAYEAPRVREDRALADREGGGGGRGERGHTNVELRKQEIRARMAKLQAELRRLRDVQTTRSRRRDELPRVGLVGYTNAGKSSLMRALTGSDVKVEDRLFATLGTTVRALTHPGPTRILVSDTVGFLRNLPHELLASFHTTLEEARTSDLLLLVVDASDPRWPGHLEVTRATLAEIGADHVPARIVFNKIDRLSAAERAGLAVEFPRAALVSAHDPGDVASLRDEIVAAFEEDAREQTVVVPIADGALIAEILGVARVLDAKYTDTVARLHVRAHASALDRWTRRIGTS